MREYYHGNERLGLLSNDELLWMTSKVKRRFEKSDADAHGIGYILDPAFCGKGMIESDEVSVTQFIMNDWPTCLETRTHDRELMAGELQEFRVDVQKMEDRNDPLLQSMKNGTISPKSFWFVQGNKYPHLRPLALRIFSMSCSSAASERNFSEMAYIHSKSRNSLLPETLAKVMFVKVNSPSLSSKRLFQNPTQTRQNPAQL